jgi:hypothetical protein
MTPACLPCCSKGTVASTERVMAACVLPSPAAPTISVKPWEGKVSVRVGRYTSRGAGRAGVCAACGSVRCTDEAEFLEAGKERQRADSSHCSRSLVNLPRTRGGGGGRQVEAAQEREDGGGRRCDGATHALQDMVDFYDIEALPYNSTKTWHNKPSSAPTTA